MRAIEIIVGGALILTACSQHTSRPTEIPRTPTPFIPPPTLIPLTETPKRPIDLVQLSRTDICFGSQTERIERTLEFQSVLLPHPKDLITVVIEIIFPLARPKIKNISIPAFRMLFNPDTVGTIVAIPINSRRPLAPINISYYAPGCGGPVTVGENLGVDNIPTGILNPSSGIIETLSPDYMIGQDFSNELMSSLQINTRSGKRISFHFH